MRKKLKSIAVFLSYAVGGLIGAFLCIWLVMYLIFGDFLEGCAITPSVEHAKSLSQERLQKLYYQMEKITNELESDYDPKYDGMKYPQISDIKFVLIRKSSASMMLGGCFDSKVFLKFGGLGSYSDKNSSRSITLTWGEYPINVETLWEE